MPGDLRGVKPTNESCNRHKDLVPAVDPKVVCEPFPSPFSCSLGVPRGKPTKLCQTVDYERALNLVKCYSQSASNFASRETWKETLLNKTQEILKVSLKIFDFSLLSCNQEQSSQPSPLEEDMPISASRAKSADLKLGCGTWNSPEAFSHSPGPVLPTQGPIQWSARNIPRDLARSTLIRIPGNKVRPTIWGLIFGHWNRPLFQCHPTEQSSGGSILCPRMRQNPCLPGCLVISPPTAEVTVHPETAS